MLTFEPTSFAALAALELFAVLAAVAAVDDVVVVPALFSSANSECRNPRTSFTEEGVLDEAASGAVADKLLEAVLEVPEVLPAPVNDLMADEAPGIWLAATDVPTPTICSMDCSRLLNRFCVELLEVEPVEEVLLSVEFESVFVLECTPFLWPCA